MKKLNLKQKILMYFSLSITVVLIIMWVSFQIAANSYIISKAKSELLSTSNLVDKMAGKKEFQNSGKIPSALKTQLRTISKVSKFVGNTNFFIVSNKKNIVIYPRNQKTEESEEVLSSNILNALNESYPEHLLNTLYKISAENREYYLIARKPELWSNEIILYTDISLFGNFVHSINLVLILVFLLGGVLAAVCSLWISNKIAKPVNELCSFARAVGNGSFDVKPSNFYDKEFVELAEDMNHMAMQLKEYDNEQKQFFQNVSHDLRTPLMSIQGYAEGIMHEVFNPPHKTAAIIVDECERLTSMINDILFISKWDSNSVKLNNDELNLVDLLESVITTANGLAVKQNKKIIFNREVYQMAVTGDEQSLHRAFLNLLSNCIRHAKEVVTISLSVEETFIQVSIKDDGKGFDHNDLDNIFKRNYKGTNGEFGIGLSIVKTILDYHNTTIWPKNNNGGEFIIRFNL